MLESFSVTEKQIKCIRVAQTEDAVGTQLSKYYEERWLIKDLIPNPLFSVCRCEWNVQKYLLLRGNKIIVPMYITTVKNA